MSKGDMRRYRKGRGTGLLHAVDGVLPAILPRIRTMDSAEVTPLAILCGLPADTPTALSRVALALRSLGWVRQGGKASVWHRPARSP